MRSRRSTSSTRLTGGGPGTSTETISFYIYKAGYQFFRLGYGAAAFIVMLIVLSVLLTILLRVLRGRWHRLEDRFICDDASERLPLTHLAGISLLFSCWPSSCFRSSGS